MLNTVNIKKVFSRLLLILLGVACALAGSEALLRLTDFSLNAVDTTSWDRPAQFVRTDWHVWTRNCEPAFRMAVIGDSFTIGVGVQEDDTYAARLERMLNANTDAPPAEVRIYAKAGTSTFQQLHLLAQAREWKPNVVVLGVCLNDPENHAKPDTLRLWREEMWPQPAAGWLAFLTRHLKAAELVYRQLENRRARQGYIRYYERLYDKGYSGWLRFAYSLHVFKERCNEAGTKLLVVIFPLLSEDFRQGRYPFEAMHQAIREVLDTENIACLDLLDSFRSKLAIRMQAIPNIDPHPSEIAHRIAAESILERLRALNWIDERAVPDINPNTAAFHQVWLKNAMRMQGCAADAGAGQ